jgi:hypothetical protein
MCVSFAHFGAIISFSVISEPCPARSAGTAAFSADLKRVSDLPRLSWPASYGATVALTRAGATGRSEKQAGACFGGEPEPVKALPKDQCGVGRHAATSERRFARKRTQRLDPQSRSCETGTKRARFVDAVLTERRRRIERPWPHRFGP